MASENTQLQPDLPSKKKGKLLTPARIIVLGYITVILVGAFLLWLPAARQSDTSGNFLNSIFDATSAVCITGFLLYDIANYYTMFGQIVILVLIQIGGLGFMSITTLMFLLLGRRISLRERLVMQEAMNQDSFGGIISVIKRVIILTFIVQFIGFLFLLFVFVPVAEWRGVYYAVFYSVAAFCNAGVSVSGFALSEIAAYRLLKIILTCLTLLGGLGYLVIFDIGKNWVSCLREKRLLPRWRYLATHTKIVIYASVFLIVVSTLTFVFAEYNYAFSEEGFGGSLLYSVFLSINARSSGFGFVDTYALSEGSRLILIANMFIGASPASTGGGIKTTTAFLIFVYFLSTIRLRREVTVNKSTISHRHLSKAITIFVFAIMLLFAATFILTWTDGQFYLGQLFFEVASALGTVGLSVGVISDISNIGKILFIFLMLIGRIGILTFGMSFYNSKYDDPKVKWAEAKILVG
ncbi:MAG: Trk family potassium uptake protein [Firmicutes bacterium]|nr:Trk family potassium uptake protein [Bacillota bacterium]